MQLSVAVASRAVFGETHVHPEFVLRFWLVLNGQVTTGAVLSRTVTVKLHEEVRALPSVAVQVTVVKPLLNTLPFNVVPVPEVTPESEYATVTVPQLSVAVASSDVFGETHVHPEFVLRFVFPLTGQVITGTVLSKTVTVKLQVEVRALPSVAVHVTVVNPLLNITPFNVVPVPDVTPERE